MEQENLTATIEVAQSAEQVFHAITDVTKWWSKDFVGNSLKLNDEFIIHHPNQHYSKQKLVEVIPYKKIVWLVTESNLNWIKGNKDEWTNTRMIFEISSKGDNTLLHFTHEGLVPEKECYPMCSKGWNMIIKNWLFHFITTGIPSPEIAKAADIRNQLLKDMNYHRTILVNASPAEAMKKISQINHWWKHDFIGNAERQQDRFTVPFNELNGEKSFVDFVVSEIVPNEKVVWKVTNCNLPWFKDKTEWNNTEVVFEISPADDKATIDFTHVGLVPGVECYEACERGWDGHVTNSLVRFINEGKGIPQ